MIKRKKKRKVSKYKEKRSRRRKRPVKKMALDLFNKQGVFWVFFSSRFLFYVALAIERS